MGLKQHDGPDVAPAGFLLLLGLQLQVALQLQRRVNDFGQVVVVIDDDGQLHHVLLFERQRVHEADDVAVFARRGRQVEDEGGVQVLEHVHAQVTLRVVAFVDHHHWVQGLNHAHEGDILVVAQQRAEGLQVAVFLVHLPVFLVFSPQGVEAEHHQAQLLLHAAGRKAAALQQGRFVVHFDAAGEVSADFLAVGMQRVAQAAQRLVQNGDGGHQPHHGLGPVDGKSGKNGTQGVAGNKGFAAGCGHLDGDVRHARHSILVRLDGRAWKRL